MVSPELVDQLLELYACRLIEKQMDSPSMSALALSRRQHSHATEIVLEPYATQPLLHFLLVHACRECMISGLNTARTQRAA